MFTKILLATDFSEAARAARFASISLAARCLGKIEALHVITFLEDVYYSFKLPVPKGGWQKTVEREMENFFPKQLYPNSGRKVISGRSIPSEILKHAREQKFDLVVLGSHGRNALGRFFLGSVTQRMTRSSEIPVMVVRDLRQVNEPYQGYDRILIPTDFSDISETALDLGVRFATFLQAELHLIHVVDLSQLQRFQEDYPLTKVKIPDTCELNVDSTLKQMIQAREFLGMFKLKTLFGDPENQILEYARENQIHFIILGSHGRRELHRVRLGSVTTGVVGKATVPVITISGLIPQGSRTL